MTRILTAQAFIAQGTSAGAIMSIASCQTNGRDRITLEGIAREVSLLTGQSLQIPGALTKAREERRRKPANDNRQSGRVTA